MSSIFDYMKKIYFLLFFPIVISCEIIKKKDFKVILIKK